MKFYVYLSFIIVLVINANVKASEPNVNVDDNDDIILDTLSLPKTTNLTVYYETLCPDSIGFIKNELFPAWVNRGDKMNLKLVPYGKAIHFKQDDKWIFHCQHGERECKFNILHACILDELPLERAFPLINCLLTYRPKVSKCAERNNVTMTTITACSEGARGKELFVEAGQLTNTIDLTYVPSLEIDNLYSYNEQFHWFRDFDGMFCRRHLSQFKECLTGCCAN